ncbi:hypothetical protein N9N12_01975, partial [Candidatus Poseidoniales archaeon]|nr:hypothetical protein [Candidatus Poseidoniales archaeon]
MTGTEAAFSVKNGFGEIVSDEDTLTLKMNPHVSKESPNYQFLIPLEINFSKKNKDSVLRIEIEARVDNNAWSPTAQTFRGQIISTVEDKKRTERTGINLFSNLHALHSPNNSTSMSVERDQWEEGKNPKIEFITTTDKGVIEFGLLGIFSDDGRGPSPYLLDQDTYLKINLLEKIGTSSKIIRSFKIMFDEKEGLTEFDFIEDHLIKRYQSRSHAIEGDGYALHPKQLLTVELLDQLLSPEVIDALGGKIDLGYIGLDTGENVISVLRHLKRKKLIPYIETLTIIFYPDWDNDYRKILTQHIEQSQIENIKWVNAKKGVDDEGKEVRVDIMISTYVAVWAHNEYQMDSGETEEYFSAAWKNCKEQALLLSIDPIESSKIARSREFAGRCDVDEFYQDEGFTEDESIRIKGINPTCVAKVWKKGEWKSEDVPFRGAPEAPKRRFIQVLGSIGDLIDCAGYPTHSVPLVKANVLKHEDTKLINPEQGSSQNPSVGVLETEGDSKMAGNRVFLNKSTASPLDSTPTSPIYPCGTEFVELEFAVNKADREQLATSFSRFESTMGPLLESGFLEIPLSIYSPYPVVVLGEPGAGKSVRLKQIVGEIINNRDIKHVPLYIKAKQLAKTIGEISEHKVNTSDFNDAAEILAKAYHASNPIFSRHDFTVESLIEEFKHINGSNQKINDSNLILLIDAIDEIQDQDIVEKVLRWIKRFGQNFGLGYSRSIISSRPTHMTQIRNVFASLNQFSMFYENHTLQKEFSGALIGEWNMSEELSKKVQDYIQEDGIFQHINTPLLIGWLCRFIRDRKEIGDLGNSYDFYELILDQAIRNKRFELEVSFTEQQFESIRTIRNLIAFIGLLNLDKNSQLGRIDLSMKETRHNLLAIRKEKDSLTPGLEKFTDEEMHRMFFEDMSLIFVSGHGEVEWTHEHLKEYAAALFATKGLESGHKMVGFLQSLSNNYEVAGVDLNEIVNQRIMPKRAYFRDAVIHKTSSELVSEIWSESSAVSPIVNKLRHLRNNIAHFEDSVTASEYADLLRSPLVSDEFPKEAKEYLQLIVNDFSKRDLNWIVQAEKRPNKAHAELLTGGVIPILAQKILNEDERMALFRPLIPSDSVFEFNSFSFDEIKGLYFERFLKSEIDASLPSMQVLLAGEFRNQSTIIEKNNLKLSPEYYRRLHEKYTLSSKKFVENSTSEKYLFNTFNEMVQPNSDNPLEGPLLYQLKKANLENDSKRVYEVLKNLKPLIMKKFEIKKLEYVELLTATVETYSANQSEDEGILCAWCYTQLASIANENNNFDQAEEFLSFAIDIERKFGFRSDEAGSLRFYSDIYAKK